MNIRKNKYRMERKIMREDKKIFSKSTNQIDREEELWNKQLIIELEKDRIIDIIPLLIREKYVSGESEFRRLISQGEICINEETLVMDDLDMVLACGDILKIGKENFIKIIK
jgi:tyrosyl-tRNA synthetase